uniref:Uncharacterized protein n=1 Tax=Sphaerodactylus townsendi TaxID=933632 RepID=A0ACB8GAY4_9SAUR
MSGPKLDGGGGGAPRTARPPLASTASCSPSAQSLGQRQRGGRPHGSRSAAALPLPEALRRRRAGGGGSERRPRGSWSAAAAVQLRAAHQRATPGGSDWAGPCGSGRAGRQAPRQRHDLGDSGGWQRQLLQGRGREWPFALLLRGPKLDGSGGAPRTVRPSLSSKFHRLLPGGMDLVLRPVELPPASASQDLEDPSENGSSNVVLLQSDLCDWQMFCVLCGTFHELERSVPVP